MEYNRLHYKKGLHYESIRFADVVLCMNQLDVKRAVDQWGNGEYRYSRYEINDDQYNSEEIDFVKRYIRKDDSMRNVLLKIHIQRYYPTTKPTRLEHQVSFASLLGQ